VTDVPDFMRSPMQEHLAALGELFDRCARTPDPPRERPPFVPGVFEGMPAEQYFAIEAMSQSGTKKMLKSPAHYKLERDQPGEPTAAMVFGTAVHTGVLEPDSFASKVQAVSVGRRTKAFIEQAKHSPGVVLLTDDEYDSARRCIDAVLASKPARHLLSGAIVETALFWMDREFDVPCKARLDIRSHGGITDLKTSTSAAPEDYSRSLATFGYDVQAAFYFSGHEHLLDATPEFFAHIVVESEPPHAVACYVIGTPSILAGRRLADQALARYAQALRTGTWEGYPERIEEIDTPAWRRRF
jgi:hypothetical protein